MKFWIISCLILCRLSALAQSVFQNFEVDSTAMPHGGIASLNTFIQANLRKPIKAESSGIGGTIVVTGIVETDGLITDVSVTKSLRPDCDREAVRVFSLFNAWKPAQKDGKAVRQRVNIPIAFKPNAPFPYSNGNQVSYFDAANNPVSDSSIAVYKQIAPVDTSGIPTDDIVLYRRRENGWKKDFRLALVRKKDTAPGSSAQLVGYQNSNQQWEGQVFALDKDRNRIRQTSYQNGKRAGSEITYFPNGAIEQKSDELDDRTVHTSWYPNGQIRQVSSETKTTYSTHDSSGQLIKLNSPVLVMGFWAMDGQQLIRNGNGHYVAKGLVTSYKDPSMQTEFTEEGMYRDGLKEGVWTVRYADNSFYYADEYVDGFFNKGKACTIGKDTVRYTVVDMMPEFDGGVEGIKKFLAQHLRYPVNAQRARIQGMVTVSFVVNADGTSDDYKVDLSVHPDLDREALRVAKLMSGRWKPRLQRGQKVSVKYTLPVNFSFY